jgi:uncharacterized protein (DUF934 family)
MTTENNELTYKQPQPHLIKNGQVIEDTWQVVALPEEGEISSIPLGNVLVPLAVWQTQKNLLKASGQALGLWLEAADDVSVIAADLPQFDVVAIFFPKFSDGRGYSNARLIRERYGFTGEIRAVGDVLHDQLYFMSRVGFDAFALRGHKNVDLALKGAFKTFTAPYQHAVDIKDPLFRRRAV